MSKAIDVADVQGIALSGYGHMPRAAFLFFQIREAAGGTAWLRRMFPQILSGEPWPERPDGTKEKPLTAVNIAFTYEGLAALGLSRQSLKTFAPEFRAGITSRAEIIGDSGESAPENWELGGPGNKELHGVLMLYAVSEHRLRTLVEKQREQLERAHRAVIEVDTRHGFRPDDLKEHFGFHDGISQPAVEGVGHTQSDEQIPTAPGEFLLGYLNAYGLYPGSPAIPEEDDPSHILRSFPDDALPGYKDLGRNGSYLVYRKLAQDVAGFWQFIEANANGQSDEMIRMAAKFFGRWPSGAPVTLSPACDDSRLSDQNDFLFMKLDPDGYRCPIGSHIRRANPRDSRVNDTPEESLNTSSRHRLLRRGISYGSPLFDRAALDAGEAPLGLEDDGEDRGLHFFAINSSIQRQFEFLQQTWCDSATFNAEFETKDPIIGCNDGTTAMTLQAVPTRQRIRNLPRFVRVSGGAYMFLPGISALRYLAKDAA